VSDSLDVHIRTDALLVPAQRWPRAGRVSSLCTCPVAVGVIKQSPMAFCPLIDPMVNAASEVAALAGSGSRKGPRR